MHELGIMTDVLETALRVAAQNGGKKVKKITLKVGLMSGIMPQYVQSFFEVIAKDTIAKDAVIEIDLDPAVYRCLDCEKITTYHKLGPEYVCQHCGSKSLRLLSGYGFQIVSVAIV